jgi:hypothetical protein
LVIINAKEIKWYHDEDELKKGKRPLGVIYLASVYHCVPANTKMNTVDINVISLLILIFRSGVVLGGKKIKKKKGEENSYLVQKMLWREMSGSLALSI